jgi:organic radical activating enzyme
MSATKIETPHYPTRSIMKKYRVNEIFYSLQGEGYFTGTASVFLRFSGCNLSCGFCDTDHFDGREMTADEIVAEVSQYAGRHIVITGGEPTLQLDDALVEALKTARFFIQIETNGTRPVPRQVDWVTCSPKYGELNIDRVDELKIVYEGFDGMDVEQLKARFDGARQYYLQPRSGENITETIAYIEAHPWWRLSLQTHKLLDIR